ncbi:MAG TPA: hypothetical protein PLO69_05100 [Gammaproteobacteria bacterium]|nr:hypothetical protein [Gammaproteobacteria bacterium]
MRLDLQDIDLCAQHLRMCVAVAGGDDSKTSAPLSDLEFLHIRCMQLYGRRIPKEAYWAAAEHAGLVDAGAHGHRIAVPPEGAWALIAAKNERLGLPTFHGLHPTVEHGNIWALLPKAMRILATEHPSLFTDAS